MGGKEKIKQRKLRMWREERRRERGNIVGSGVQGKVSFSMQVIVVSQPGIKQLGEFSPGPRLLGVGRRES